jgi:hypothetical protein
MGKTSRRVRTKQTKEELKKIKIILMEKVNMSAEGEQMYLSNKDKKLIGRGLCGCFLTSSGAYTINGSIVFKKN